MAARVKKVFSSTGSWECPAGVRSIFITILPGSTGTVILRERIPVVPAVVYTVNINVASVSSFADPIVVAKGNGSITIDYEV